MSDTSMPLIPARDAAAVLVRVHGGVLPRRVGDQHEPQGLVVGRQPVQVGVILVGEAEVLVGEPGATKPGAAEVLGRGEGGLRRRRVRAVERRHLVVPGLWQQPDHRRVLGVRRELRGEPPGDRRRDRRAAPDQR